MRIKGITDAKVQNVALKTPETIPGIDPRALSGTELAKALVGHIARVGASGYSNELLVDGETWVIGIAKGNSRWRST